MTSRGLPARSAPAAVIALLLAGGCLAQPTPIVQPRAPSQFVPLQQLRRGLDSLLASPALEQGTWGVLVKSPSCGETLYSSNAGKLLLPSSTMKILTLASAVERLGWDYTYETRLTASGPITAGVLNGDLVAIGSGDPSIDDW